MMNIAPLNSGVGGIGKADLNEVKKSDKKSGGLSFEQTLNELGASNETVQGQLADERLTKISPNSLDKKPALSTKPILKFSNHAIERMNTRGITFSPEQITKIEQGMQKAGEKGAKESLVLTDDSALIVSLKNNTVVTVMDKSMLKENVFTNIDSTVFV